MSHEDPTPRSDASDSRAVDIRAARAQFEAARGRQQRTPSRRSDMGPPAIPRYSIVRELHRGGQGVVYLGVQESTDRRVAIKILDRVRGGSSGMGLARFEREVEALSLLKHPNVVTIHDCGRDNNQFYLVMDFVDGRPLDAYVAAERPELRDTLELFAQVCDGVNAAHLRGVIHRDLKPGNILVDGRGQPHVLDFGLAKLTDPSSTMAMTETGQFVGSLPWASPEQAGGRAEQLDIRTDVYSLGVVLFQVLTGQFPYPVSGHLVEVARHIAGTEPALPSDLRPTIDRELETIILKCLAKEPDRRYQSAGELARDIRRYLSGEPIEARRDSLAYILTKQVVRYRRAAAAGAVVLAAVLCALVISLVMWRRAAEQGRLARLSTVAAQQAASRADTEADQARAVVEFMRGVLTSVEPESSGADVKLIRVLANASATASQQFAAHPTREAEVRDLLGRVYYKLSLWTESKAEFGLAAQLWQTTVGPDDARTLTTLSAYTNILLNMGQTAEADRLLQDLLPRLERVSGPDDPLTLEAQRGAAIVMLFRGHPEEAERELVRLRSHPRLTTDDAAQSRILSALVAVHSSRLNTSDTEARDRTLAAAEPLALEWIERCSRVEGPNGPNTLHAMTKWASITSDSGRYREAADACRRILETSAERLGECHHVRSHAMYILAEALARLGQGEGESADLMLRSIACLRKQMSTQSPVFLGTVSDSLQYLDRAGRAPEGEALARELTDTLRKLGGGHDEMLRQAEPYVAAFVSMQGRFDEAEARFRAALDAPEIADRRVRARLHVLYGQHLTRRNQFQHAEDELKLAASTLDDLKSGTWDTHPDDVIVALIGLYEAWGRADKVAEYSALQAAARAR